MNPSVPLNFLLGCSQTTLDQYRLARMSEAAHLRKQIQELFDKLREVDLLVQVALWFGENDRHALKRALESEEDAVTWANRMIRGGGNVLPRLRMDLEEAREHRRESAKNYQQRNISEGKCNLCPEPLDRNSVQHCTHHLELKRKRQREKAKLAGKYARGRHPNTIAALARANARHKEE